MESASRSTNNEKRALKNNRRAKQNFRSVCSSLESNLKTQKNCIDASKVRFLKLMKGKLPSITASRNDIGKTSNLGNRLTNDSRSIKDEKGGFRYQRLVGNEKNFKLISVETETFSSYYNKIKNKGNFDNGNPAFSNPLVKAKRSRRLSRSLSDLPGLTLRMNDKIISAGCAERVRKISTSIPEYLGENLDEKKEEADSYNYKKLQDEFRNKSREDKPKGKQNLSKSVGDLISSVYQKEATVFRGLMIKNRAIIEQTHRSDCDRPKSRTRRPHSSGHVCRPFERHLTSKEMKDLNGLSPKLQKTIGNRSPLLS